jgi:hypothetical protein
MTRKVKDPMDDAIELQNAEFDALTELAKQWGRLQMTPPVDDDYPAGATLT